MRPRTARRMRRTAVAVALAAILVLCMYSLVQAAHADVTPIIMPSKPTVPEMSTGVTVKPTDENGARVAPPSALETPSVTPPVTAVPFGGELG